MWLKGSCHCQSVQFQLWSKHFYPFNHCYCSICRKTAGTGGYAINLSADAETLKVSGVEHLNIYQAKIDGEVSSARRFFCKICGSALWLYDPKWPELIHPHSSAIDTELPQPPERTHLLLNSKATWVEVCQREKDQYFAEYPNESIADWHQRLKLEDEGEPSEEPSFDGQTFGEIDQ